MKAAEFRALQKKSGLTPLELARLIGVAPSSVYRWQKIGAKEASEFSRRVLGLLQDTPARKLSTLDLKNADPLQALYNLLRFAYRSRKG